MIFVSAQPAEDFFLWQIKVMLNNFNRLGIQGSDIHILFGYKDEIPLNVIDFVQNNREAQFFFYEDTRLSKVYLSSIRPHILAKHFKLHANLSQECIFYHDVDILFTENFDGFESLLEDEIWYFSPANYIAASQVISIDGLNVLKGMCEIVGIDRKLVQRNDINAGGAQYIMKNLDYTFWDKVELDCENIYKFLLKNEEKKPYKDHISSWCTDMYVVYWNSLLNAKVKSVKELDFCWPHDDIKRYSECSIFHNSGVFPKNAKDYFYKSGFYSSEPYFKDFSFVSEHCCSSKYVEEIYKTEDKLLYNANDCTFIIPIKIDSPERYENLITSVSFLLKFFECKILILEADISQKVYFKHPNVECLFIYDASKIYRRQMYNNQMAALCTTKIIIKYDCDVIIPPSQIYQSILKVRYDTNKISYPYDGRFINAAGPLKSEFIATKNIRIFDKYLLKVWNSMFLSCGGCVVLNRNTYLQVGGDNEKFNGWGFEDQELKKRFEILGLFVHRAKGALYHLSHPQLNNSYFFSEEEKNNSYKIYLDTCASSKHLLEKYGN
ncbi:MAG: hypothetical protein LBJ04_03910 [Sphingobacterium sp.]|jgi:hypothetical protein|nr:hypothetical protein [Sphingobacterium sp.]